MPSSLRKLIADDALVASLGAYSHALYFAGRARRRLDGSPQGGGAPAGGAAAAGPRVRPLDARAGGSRARPPGVGAHPRRESKDDPRGRRQSAQLARRARLGRARASCSRVRAGSPMPSGSLRLRSISSAMRWRRSTRRGPCSSWPRVRCRRGRLDEAEAASRAAREGMDELPECSILSALASAVESELAEERIRAESGKLLTPPSEAELAVLRLLDSDLSVTAIAARISTSRRTPSAHTRERCTASSASTRAPRPWHAPRRSGCWSKRNHACDRGHLGRASARIRAMLAWMPSRQYRLTLEGRAQRPSGDCVRGPDPDAGRRDDRAARHRARPGRASGALSAHHGSRADARQRDVGSRRDGGPGRSLGRDRVPFVRVHMGETRACSSSSEAAAHSVRSLMRT